MHDDLVRKQFTADAPDTVWLTDITGHPTGEGKLCLCAIKDVYSGRIVGYSIDSRMKASLAVSALRNAVALRDPAGTIVHSDRGSQFRSRKFVYTLSRNGLVGSMGRVGACGDGWCAVIRRNSLLETDLDTASQSGQPERSLAQWPHATTPLIYDP